MSDPSMPTWQAIVPVPLDAPPATFKHNSLGDPTSVYEYVTAKGERFGYVCRFIGADGKKTTRPRHYGYFNGQPKWAWKGSPAGRPLYNVRDLVTRIDVPILFLEGEKTVDAARNMFPSMSCITTMGGSQVPHLADFSPLKGRMIIVWRDNDLPGRKYADAVARFCMHSGAAEVRVVDVPGDFPDKWDLADDLPDGVTPYFHPSLKGMYVNEHEIFEALTPVVEQITIDDDMAIAVAKALNANHLKLQAKLRREVESYQGAVRDIENREDEAYRDIKRGLLTEDMYIRHRQQLRDERERLTALIFELQSSATDTYLQTAKSILELAKDAKRLWLSRSREERVEFLKKVLWNPRITGRTVEYELRKPFAVVAKMAANGEWGG